MFSITASLAEMVEILISYLNNIRNGFSDTIPFNKIDNGMIASPEYGIADIFYAVQRNGLRHFASMN